LGTTITKHTDARLAGQLLAVLPRLGQVWSDAVRETHGGSVVRMKALGMLSRSGPTRSGELASFCGSTPSAMTELIEGLVADGYARRDADPTDRRVVLVAISPAGQAEVDRVVAAATANILKLLEHLTADQRARLRAAVADLTEIFTTASAQKETRNVR